MPLDMPPMDTAKAVEKDKESSKIEYQQKAGTSSEDVLNKLMKEQGVTFGDLKLKSKKVENPNETIRKDIEKREAQISKKKGITVADAE